MTVSLTEARRLETYLNTAIQLDGQMPQYTLLLAMLKRDYYETNGMKVPSPNAAELLIEIDGQQINKSEIDCLLNCAKVANRNSYLNHLSVL